jgi:hypothetical protein
LILFDSFFCKKYFSEISFKSLSISKTSIFFIDSISDNSLGSVNHAAHIINIFSDLELIICCLISFIYLKKLFQSSIFIPEEYALSIEKIRWSSELLYIFIVW